MSKDEDFFMFHPIENSMGFELRARQPLTPWELEKYLWGVKKKDGSHFTFEWGHM